MGRPARRLEARCRVRHEPCARRGIGEAGQNRPRRCRFQSRPLPIQQVDAVIVATLNSALAPNFRWRPVQHGKHVLVEKPGGHFREAELDEVDCAGGQKTGVRVRVGFNHRYHPALRKAHELCGGRRAGGEMMFVRGRYGHGGRLGYEREWRANPAVSGGGELIDQGVHLIDLARWFLGDFKTGWPGGRIPISGRCRWTTTRFLSLRNAAGNTAWLHVSCSEWKNLFSLRDLRPRRQAALGRTRRQLRRGAADVLQNAAANGAAEETTDL